MAGVQCMHPSLVLTPLRRQQLPAQRRQHAAQGFSVVATATEGRPRTAKPASEIPGEIRVISTHGSSVPMRQLTLGSVAAATSSGSNGVSKPSSSSMSQPSSSNGRVSRANGNGCWAPAPANGKAQAVGGQAASPMVSGNPYGEAQRLVGGASSSSPNGSGQMVLAQQTMVLPTLQATARQAVNILASERAGELVVETDMDAADLLLDTDFRWAQDSYSPLRRNVDIWAFILALRTRLWALDQKWTYAGGHSEAKRSERARGIAEFARKSILQLGPTFIKIGQLCSSRPDLFPAEVTQELAKLQDRVPAFPPDKAVGIIEADLGAPVDVLFRRFERRPIAAASLGQVHRAQLHTGESVVVKVQRPGLKGLFDIDLAAMKKVAQQLDKGDEARDFVGIYQECANILYEEIDYVQEGRNADRFRRNFRGAGWLSVPRVHWRYSSPRVLTLDYLPGIKITDLQGLQAVGLAGALVAERATQAYLEQILKHGFLHADPHPGNIAVEPGTGRLLFYDFGMMTSVPAATREKLLEVFYGVYRKDTDAVIKALVDLDIIVATGDRVSLRRSIGYFLDNISRQTERKETLAVIGEDLFAIALDQPFRFPAAFTFVLRAFSTLEGIGKALDPGFKFAEVARPYAQDLLALQDAGARQTFLLQQLGQQATSLGQAAAAMPRRVQRIDETLAAFESGDLRLRVRVLESERAARRQGVMQAATINAVGAAGAVNLACQLALADLPRLAAVAVLAAAVFGFLLWRGSRRIKRLDEFEKNIRG